MTRRTTVKLAIGLVLLLAFAAVWFSPLREHLTKESIYRYVDHVRGLWYGPLAFIGLFAAACVFAMPASIFVLAAGFIWGWALGGSYAIVGGLLGAIASFFIGRFMGEGLLERFGRIGKLVGKQVDHAGFRSLLVLRFIPGIPFPVLNYGAGVAGVRFIDYLLATLVGITPNMFVFTYCADALLNGSMSEGDAFLRLLVVCVLMLTITLLPVAIKRYSRRIRVAGEPVQ